MTMTRHFITATLMTVVTTLLLGVAYPLVVTALAQVMFPDQANGQLLERNGRIIGSRIIGQPFTSPGYFYSRPSAAGNGYDAGPSSGSKLGPTQKKLNDRGAATVPRPQTGEPGVRPTGARSERRPGVRAPHHGRVAAQSRPHRGGHRARGRRSSRHPERLARECVACVGKPRGAHLCRRSQRRARRNRVGSRRRHRPQGPGRARRVGCPHPRST